MSIPILGSGLVFPVLEVILSDPQTGRAWLLGPCCFQDLLNTEHDEFELAGMGLAILGNICQGISNGNILMRYDAVIQLRLAEGAPAIQLPWPGMLDDRPLKLNLAEMPMDHTMFLDTSDGKFKRRPDRIALLDRIKAVWVPHLKAKLAFGGVMV